MKIGNIYKIIFEDKDILNKKEKKYLSAVIKPFRDKIKGIRKGKCGRNFEYEYIAIITNDAEDNIFFPNFKSGTMYKNMKVYKEYTLEELGL